MQLPVKRLSEMEPNRDLIRSVGSPAKWLLLAVVAFIAMSVAVWLLPGHRVATFVVGMMALIGCLMRALWVLEDRSDLAGKLKAELYSAYLLTLDPNQLRLVAVSPEYDDATKAAVTSYLNEQFTGWSMVPPGEPVQAMA